MCRRIFRKGRFQFVQIIITGSRVGPQWADHFFHIEIYREKSSQIPSSQKICIWFSNKFYFILIFGMATIEKKLATKHKVITGKLFFIFIILFSVKSNAFKEIRKGDSLSTNQYCFIVYGDDTLNIFQPAKSLKNSLVNILVNIFLRSLHLNYNWLFVYLHVELHLCMYSKNILHNARNLSLQCMHYTCCSTNTMKVRINIKYDILMINLLHGGIDI